MVQPRPLLFISILLKQHKVAHKPWLLHRESNSIRSRKVRRKVRRRAVHHVVMGGKIVSLNPSAGYKVEFFTFICFKIVLMFEKEQKQTKRGEVWALLKRYTGDKEKIPFWTSMEAVVFSAHGQAFSNLWWDTLSRWTRQTNGSDFSTHYLSIMMLRPMMMMTTTALKTILPSKPWVWLWRRAN